MGVVRYGAVLKARPGTVRQKYFAQAVDSAILNGIIRHLSSASERKRKQQLHDFKRVVGEKSEI